MLSEATPAEPFPPSVIFVPLVMRVAILSAREGWHTDQLCRSLETRGHEAIVRPYDSLIALLGRASALRAESEELLNVDAVLPRIIPNGSLEQIIYRVDALHWLEDRGIPVMNSPRTIERTVDKFYTSALLFEAGLGTPETVICERFDDALAAFKEMRDVIVKPLFGSMGLGMVRVSDEETAWRVFRALEAIRGVYYLQRAIAHPGRDIRVFVVGDHVIGAIERVAPGWRTNIAQGATARRVDLPDSWRDAALTAARVVGAEYAGVDLLPASDGALYVLEVNGIPGWRGLQDATSIDVADVIVRHLAERYAPAG